MQLVQPITDADRARFMELAPRLLNLKLDEINIEEVDEHWQVSYATTDIGSASGPFKKSLALDLSSVNNEGIQTQDPKLNGAAVNAGDQVAMMCALQGVLYKGAVSMANRTTIFNDLKQGVLRADNSNNRRFELAGSTVFCTAPDFLDSAGTGISGAIGSEIMRKLGGPFTIGKDQKFSFTHIIARTTAWPAAFVVDYWAPCLIARKK